MKKIVIKNWKTGKVILSGKYKSIKDCLEKNRNTDLRYAKLNNANLKCADLSYADLNYADLKYAKLNYANLRCANLSYTDLNNIPILNVLSIREYIKKYKIKKVGTKLTFYKGVSNSFKSPLYGDLHYKLRSVVKVEHVNADPQTSCGHGINISPTIKLAREFGSKVVQLEVDIMDIGCIPTANQKIRVKRVKVIKEVK